MAASEPLPALQSQETSRVLADQWRRLRRSATLVALLTSPAAFVWLNQVHEWSLLWSAVGTFLIFIAFRGMIDLAFKRAIPWPSLFGHDSKALREEDVVNRRRVWFWRFWLRFAIFATIFAVPVVLLLKQVGAALLIQVLPLLIMLPLFLIFNFVILFGPLLMLNLSQVRGFEPGDAEWGVRLDDVRGQEEAKEEVRRIVTLWQSGEAFEKAGGKRERGLLFLGPPGTGKTMLAKAIATGFNSPFVSIPGSGFAATFIGIDAIVVRYVAWKAKRLARKWGGQCIVFIDEIDAVGMRRQTLQPGAGGAAGGWSAGDIHQYLFFGPNGALNPTGDMILETRAWRERLFAERAEGPRRASPLQERLNGIASFMFPGGMGMGGGLALNQLLVVMDGIDNPPFTKRVLTNKFNTFLDATYIVPRRMRRVSMRFRAPRPRKEQIYFIGATNVPIDRLDPALIRPGRMGRHVWFRTPTQRDRLDVFDLYINKVAHDHELDTEKRRNEIARITNGYSPAMIDQVCSMALTIAHHSGRERFEWNDLVEAMTTLEAGTAIAVEYIPDETRAVAVHEAGHALASHVYMKGSESTRLSIRMRGNSLGHHQAREKDERFSSWRHEELGRLVWGLGAMAAEHVFYGENATGVSGDVYSATAQAAFMVGQSAMGPEPIEVVRPMDDESEEEARERIMKRFETIGVQIMTRTAGGGPLQENPIGAVLADRDKRAAVARILGQAYMRAYHLMSSNKDAVARVADELVARKEIYGDELIELLEAQNIQIPVVDYEDPASWPRI
jgi:cell division protease FtsH